MVKLAIKNLAKKIICDGELYLSTKDGRRFFLMQPGMFIDEEFIKKHAHLNSTFDFEQVTNEKVLEEFGRAFKELRYLQFERDLRKKAGEIVSAFSHHYQGTEHFLSFALACYQEFCLVPKDDLEKIHSTDMHLFRKSMYSAAFAVIIALSNDYYHYTMIRDFYNLTLTLDFGLCDSSYSYYVAQASNEENRLPGSGIAFMESQRATAMEMKVFHQHPLKSFEYVKASKFLAYPELAEITLYQHELANGKGIPRGVAKGQVSSWEAVVILADSLVEIQDSFSFEKDVLAHLLNFENPKLSELPVDKVHKKLCLAFDYFEKRKEQAIG